MGLFDNITGLFTGKTAQDAADKQIAGLNAAYGQAAPLFDTGRTALTTNYGAALQPFLQNNATAQTGVRGLTDALGLTGDPSQVTARLQQTPGYQFQLQQGSDNILRNAARTGSLGSGGTNVDLLKFGQGLAGTTYNNYVSNLMPFLGASNAAATGAAGVSTGLGNQINASNVTQANAAYGTQAGIGNAEANAELAKNTGAQNLLNFGMNAASLAMGVPPRSSPMASTSNGGFETGPLFRFANTLSSFLPNGG